MHTYIHELNSHNLLEQDLSLRESFEQPIEAEERTSCNWFISSSERWITTDAEHGRLEKVEMIRFRTFPMLPFKLWLSPPSTPMLNIYLQRFVNAQLGNTREGLKSVNASYMLLLWTRTGESEIFVSLFNQQRTVNLSRRSMTLIVMYT